MKKQSVFILNVSCACVFTIIIPLSSFSEDKPPTIELFTPEVISSSGIANEKIREIDKSLSGTFTEIERTRKLYESSKCSPDSSDEGCIEIKKQMQVAYLEMLEGLEQTVPELEQSFEKANQALGKRFRNQIGKKLSPYELFVSLEKDRQGARVRLGRKNSIAARTAKYLEVLSKRGGRSHEVMAAEIYIDQKDALYNLSLLNTEISYQRQMMETELKLGLFTEQTVDDADAIREVLFGNEGEGEVPDIESGQEREMQLESEGIFKDL